MTEKIGACARACASPGRQIISRNPVSGPASIEGHYDEAMAKPGLLAEVRRAEAERVDGFLVACFEDPVICACRQLATGPVIDICEPVGRLARQPVDLPGVVGERVDDMVAARVHDDVVGLEELDAVLDRARPLACRADVEAGPAHVVDRLRPVEPGDEDRASRQSRSLHGRPELGAPGDRIGPFAALGREELCEERDALAVIA